MGMNKKEIKLFITAETKKAVKALGKVEKSQKGLKKNNDKLKSSFSAMGGAIVAAFSVRAIAQFTAEAIKLGSKTIELKRAFTNLGRGVGVTEKSLDKFRKATDGTVSDIDLMIQANNAMLLGIVDSDDQFAELIDSAQRLAQAVGKDAVFGIESLTTGIGRQSKLMLDNLGIIVDTGKAYDVYAESIGKSTSELDDNEKKAAFIQATMESVREKVAQLGEEQLSAATATDAFTTAITNLKGAIGKDLQEPVTTTTNFFTTFLDGIRKSIEEIGTLNTLLELTSPVPTTAPRERFVDGSIQFDPIFTQAAIYFELGALHQEHLDNMAAADTEALEIRTGLGLEGFILDKKLSDDLLNGKLTNLKKEFAARNADRVATRKEELKMALLSGATAKEAVTGNIKAQMVEAHAALISSIMDLPFPLNIVLAAGAGSMIDKAFSALSSFPTGGSIETGVTRGRTILPIGTAGNIKVGDNASGMERIDVTPLPSPTSSGSNITININAPLVDEFVVDSIIPAIRRAEQLNL